MYTNTCFKGHARRHRHSHWRSTSDIGTADTAQARKRAARQVDKCNRKRGRQPDRVQQKARSRGRDQIESARAREIRRRKDMKRRDKRSDETRDNKKPKRRREKRRDEKRRLTKQKREKRRKQEKTNESDNTERQGSTQLLIIRGGDTRSDNNGERSHVDLHAEEGGGVCVCVRACVCLCFHCVRICVRVCVCVW